MTAVAVSSQARKTRPGRRAAPSPQARGVNLSSAPWRGRQEPLPARSGAAQAGGEDRGRTRSVSAREPAGKGRRNWARRAAARPRASCGSGSSKGGGAAAPPGVLRTTKVAWQSGQEAQNGRDESSRRPPARLDLEDPQSSSAASTRASQSAAGTRRPPLRLRGPRRARTSSCDPTPQPRVPSAEWGALGHSSVFQGYPRRPGLRAPRSPQTVGKGSGLLPRPVSGSQLAAERSSSLGIPEPIVGNCAGPSSRSPSGMPCRRGGAVRCFSGRSEKRGVAGLACGQGGGRARGGCASGAPGRGGSRESCLGRAGGGAPRGRSPGAAGPGRGVSKKPRSEATARRPGRGLPFWAGSRLGAEGGAEVV